MHIAITGAATGIGAAAVDRFKAAGHRITAFDIAEPANVDTWIELDMADMDAVAEAAEAAEGPFDVLINNAGIPPRPGNAEAMLAINVFGLIKLAEGLIPKLAEGAAIVTTASRAGQAWRDNLEEVKALLALPGPQALPGFLAAHPMDPTRAYCLSKEAVIVWNIANAEGWLARGLRGNTVSPSGVDTKIFGDFMVALGDRAKLSLERAGRAATPDEIAALIVFLASPDSHWIKGQDIVIDGGMTAFQTADVLGLS